MFKIEYDYGKVKYVNNYSDAILAMENAKYAVVWKKQNVGWKFVTGTFNAFKKDMFDDLPF